MNEAEVRKIVREEVRALAEALEATKRTGGATSLMEEYNKRTVHTVRP